jgi:hypothetical protein
MDDMNDKLMEKLTAEFEEVFHVDEPMLLVDDGPATTAEEEDRENEASMHEVSKANTVEEKQKFLDALKQNSDHIKTVMGDFLKNTWA